MQEKVHKRILIHHHASIYNSDGDIYCQSFIAKWINELATIYEEIGLLMYSADRKSPTHDTLLLGINIKFIDLGKRGTALRLIERINNINRACKSIAFKYDVLIIRGITPSQYKIWNTVKVTHRVFLLVGSLTESRPPFNFSRIALIRFFMYYKRHNEVKQISKSGFFIANSPHIVKELKSEFDINATFIPTNTISKKDIRPYKFRGFADPLKILFCGRVTEDKGIWELLNAVSILKDQGIECHLKVVGNIDSNLSNKVNQSPFFAQIKTQVEFIGFIKFGPDLLNYYEWADVYILPSYHEGFPHSIWEAGATSTPVIVTDVGGIRGLVTNDQVYFIKERSVSGIIHAVIEIISKAEEARRKTANLHELLQQYTIEQCAEKLKKYLNIEVFES